MLAVCLLHVIRIQFEDVAHAILVVDAHAFGHLLTRPRNHSLRLTQLVQADERQSLRLRPLGEIDATLRRVDENDVLAFQQSLRNDNLRRGRLATTALTADEQMWRGLRIPIHGITQIVHANRELATVALLGRVPIGHDACRERTLLRQHHGEIRAVGLDDSTIRIIRFGEEFADIVLGFVQIQSARNLEFGEQDFLVVRKHTQRFDGRRLAGTVLNSGHTPSVRQG